MEGGDGREAAPSSRRDTEQTKGGTSVHSLWSHSGWTAAGAGGARQLSCTAAALQGMGFSLSAPSPSALPAPGWVSLRDGGKENVETPT